MKKHSDRNDTHISTEATTPNLLIEAYAPDSHAIAPCKRTHGIALSYGRCSQCSCPGFIGSGYTCTRSGCGHHYDEHG